MRSFVSALLIIAFVLSGLSHGLSAQVLSPRQPEKSDLVTFSFSFFGSVAMGEFRKHENGGGGADMSLGFQPFRREPLVLRAQVAGLLYDGASAWGYQEVCDRFGSCWTEQVRYNARNHSMLLLHAGPEIMATDGRWRPFAYGLAGWTFFHSWANLKPETPSGPAPESVQLFSSRNFSSIYGAGLRRVGTRVGRESGFELSTRFVRNAKARYLTEAGLERQSDGTWNVSPRTGAANALSIHVGFWMGPYVNWNERR
jgi:hypothetical protein